MSQRTAADTEADDAHGGLDFVSYAQLDLGWLVRGGKYNS